MNLYIILAVVIVIMIAFKLLDATIDGIIAKVKSFFKGTFNLIFRREKKKKVKKIKESRKLRKAKAKRNKARLEKYNEWVVNKAIFNNEYVNRDKTVQYLDQRVETIKEEEAYKKSK